MGRIKTTLIKRVTCELLDYYPERFSTDFEKNKKTVEELISSPSKKMRNIIAGYAVRLTRQSQEKRYSNEVEISVKNILEKQ